MKLINIICRLAFESNIIQSIEDYKESTKIAVLLVRTGLARIGSILFLVITMSQNILDNKNPCERQTFKIENLIEQNPDEIIWVHLNYPFLNESHKTLFLLII